MNIADLTLTSLATDSITIQTELERLFNTNGPTQEKVELIKKNLEALILNEAVAAKLQALIENNKKSEPASE